MASGRGSGAGLCLIRPPSAAVVERMVACRRTMHRHPDLSEQEQPTCERICSWLDELGIAHRTCVGGRGVVADIPGQRAGPVIALRADTDALPLQEATELDFSSCKDGVMHACGHDGHTAGLLGAAQLLVENAVAPPLPVRLLFQPAEEVSTGAKSMIEDNALDDVAYVFGGHIDRHYPTGSIVVQPGCVNAFADAFVIRIIGKGGHAARPHQVAKKTIGQNQQLKSPALSTRAIHSNSPPRLSRTSYSVTMQCCLPAAWCSPCKPSRHGSSTQRRMLCSPLANFKLELPATSLRVRQCCTARYEPWIRTLATGCTKLCEKFPRKQRLHTALVPRLSLQTLFPA
eukprot:m.114253 g.114253  ORF g.114253 m.114253 type:complete len:344 (+) comp16286_c0_seq2:104-1135(+)